MTKQDIIELLASNDKAVARALVVINERQTADEQVSESTKHVNGRGFNAFDAAIGTSMAKFVIQHGSLTSKQVSFWRKPDKRGNMKISKYAGQLLEIAQEKAKTIANLQSA